MRKRIAAVLVVLCLAVMLEPTVSHAAVTPAFIAINDTLLPFVDENMPFVLDGVIWVPVNVFEDLKIWSTGSHEEERVLLYRGYSRYLEFSTRPGAVSTRDNNNNILNWPAARWVGSIFYVPLRQVCDFFGLFTNLYNISRDTISQQQMSLVSITSGMYFNMQTFENQNRNALRNAYNDYFTPPAPPSPPTPPGIEVPPPVEEPPPDYSGVTIYLSFYDVSAGSAQWIVGILDVQSAIGHHSCFFVSADDIINYPGLIRRISGAGHTIGIRLKEGTYEEYTETSALLFEAAKIRTVLVTLAEDESPERSGLSLNGLIVWGCSKSPDLTEDPTASDITAELPTETGERFSLMFSCSDNSELVLPGVISFLWQNDYTLERITETVEPIR